MALTKESRCISSRMMSASVPDSIKSFEVAQRRDTVYARPLRTAMKSKKFGAIGALLGASHLAGVAFKYSKSPHGVILAGAFGAACGMNFGLEVANHWYQLYKIKPADAHLRFTYWWEDKTLAKRALGNHEASG